MLTGRAGCCARKICDEPRYEAGGRNAASEMREPFLPIPRGAKLAPFLRRSCHLGVANSAPRSNERNVSVRRFNGIVVAVALFSAALVVAADSNAKIGQGSTKQQVIEVLGPPIGRANLGKVEILNYPNGQVRLENGRVERMNLRPVVMPPAPAAPAPAASGASNVPATPAASSPVPAKEPKSPLAGAWIQQFDEAVRDAARRNSPILALFTNADGSPTSRQFQKEIVFHPEFVNAFRANYVLLNLDASARTDAGVVDRLQNLREQLGVRGIPALLILSPAGERVAAVEISDSVVGSAYRGRLITAVISAYTLPTPAPVTPTAESKPAVVAPPAAVPLAQSSHLHAAPPEVSAGLTSARWFVIGALCVGTLISGAMLFVLWMVLRKLNKPVLTRRTSMASRIDHAASGLPSHAEILAWPKETLCRVIGRLAELEGFEAELTKGKGEKDLVLRRPALPTPEAIVCCVSGNAGVIPTRRLRELVGTMAAEDVASGWFVSPMGFSLDARAYAEEQNVRLIDGARLLTLLSDLPTFALPKVLAAAR
jgi:hypothetical protein